MKSYLKILGLVCAALAVFPMAGCQQAVNPVSTSPSTMASSGTAMSSPTVEATPTPPGKTSASLLGCLLCPPPTVNMTQVCSPSPASLGSSVTYTIQVAVSGSAANNVLVQDVLPSGLTYVQGTATSLSGGTFACTGQTLTWVANSVGPCTCTMSYVAKVNNTVNLVGSTLANTAVMTCSSLLTAISSAVNLLITPCACTPVMPTPTFTCTPVPPPPTHTPTFAPINTATSTCTPVPPTLTFTPVPPTNTPTFTFTNTSTPTNTFTATSTPTNTFTFTNTFTSTNTFTATNTFTRVPPTATFTFTPTNTFTAVPNTPTFTSTPAPVVSMSKTASEVLALAGDVVSYTLHLNIAGSAANSVTIQDVLPTGCSFVQGSESDSLGAAFSVSGQTLTWFMSQAGPCSCSLVYQAKVTGAAAIGAVMTNIAALTSTSLPSSVSCLCNVTMAAPTPTPIPIPTITLGQVCSPTSAALGATVTYTINLGVSGASAANCTIQDVLPAGLTYVQGTATTIAGGAFSASGQTLTWVYNSVGPCSCTMTYVAQVSNSLTGLLGETLSNSAVLTCPSLSSSLTGSANLLITGLLGGLGL